MVKLTPDELENLGRARKKKPLLYHVTPFSGNAYDLENRLNQLSRDSYTIVSVMCLALSKNYPDEASYQIVYSEVIA